MPDVLDAVRDTLRRHAMLAGGERVLIALSGGADSSALLALLVALAPEWRLSLHGLHVDHRLRPDSARDAEAARALGRRLAVPVDVVAVAVDERGSLEDAARRARYAVLEAQAAAVGADRIALGHTADDQAETVLMRLLQGSGVRGLAGIPAVRGRVIRPLIELRRRDVVGVLRGAGIDWVEDPTNRDPKFLRNRIRHEVLPLLAAAHDADVVTALGRVAREARAAITALDDLAARELARAATVTVDAVTLPRVALAALPSDVAAEMLRLAAARLGSTAPLRAWAHRGLRRVLADPPPRGPFRLGGVSVEAGSGRIRVSRGSSVTLPTRRLAVPGSVAIPEAGLLLEARRLDAAGYVPPREAMRAAFDADALGGLLLVRGRRRGDRFTPFGGPGERRLKSFLIDAKIPRWDRDRLPILEAGGAIVWVGGVRRAAAAPITATSRRIVELTLEPLTE